MVAVRRYPMSKVRSSDCALLEQWLCFAGAAVKRYPKSEVRETPTKMVGAERGHQRVDRLKPQSQKNRQSNHMGRSLV